MTHQFNISLKLFIMVFILNGWLVHVQAATVSELLDALKQRQLNVQDYDFVVARGFHIKAFDDETLDRMVEKQKAEFEKKYPSPSVEQMERFTRMLEISRASHSFNKFTGTVFHLRGLGSDIISYAVSSIPEPIGNQLKKIDSPQDDLSEQHPKPKMEFRQYRLVLPDVVINGDPPSDTIVAGKHPRMFKRENDVTIQNNAWFEFPEYSTVFIKDGGSKTNRSDYFPFWHEEALNAANEGNTEIVNENDREIEILINASDEISYHVFCTPNGRVTRYTKTSNGNIEVKVQYNNFVAITDDIKVPQAGSQWMPARDLDTASPMQEWTRFCTLLNGRVNWGLTLDDFYFKVPEQTTIIDHRQNRDLDEFRIVTDQLVRLDANVPEKLGQLLEGE